jgi:hypothetical protein
MLIFDHSYNIKVWSINNTKLFGGYLPDIFSKCMCCHYQKYTAQQKYNFIYSKYKTGIGLVQIKDLFQTIAKVTIKVPF